MANTTISIPRPKEGMSPFVVDLSLAYEAESKLGELATASSGSALHLASIFGKAYNALGRAYSLLYREVGVATVASRKRRAVVNLDLAAGILASKGLSKANNPAGSSDLRESVCYADEEFCKIEEYRASIEALKELVEIKLQTMRMSFYAVQSILKGTSSSAGNGIHDLSDRNEPSLMDRAMSIVSSPMAREFPEEEAPAPARPRNDCVIVDMTEQGTTTPRGFGKPVYKE